MATVKKLRPSSDAGAPSPESLTSGREKPATEVGPGNAALQDELQGQVGNDEHQVGGIWDTISDWFSSLFTDEEEKESVVEDEVEKVVDEEKSVEEVAHDVQEAEEEQDPTLASRPTTVRAGAVGALIGTSDQIDIHSEASVDSSVAHTVQNGKPVDVLEVEGTMIKVRFRMGDDAIEGWTSATLFSDQPSLGRESQNPDLMDDYTWELADPDQVTSEDMTGTDVSQGSLADCFFIAGMRATVTANADFFRDAITYNEGTGMYTVRFYEQADYDWDNDTYNYNEVLIEVDGYLPTNGSGDEAYAESADDATKWGGIYEKAYAKWKGGYQVLDQGGNSGAAMEALTGVKSEYQSLSSMSEDEVVPWFQNAQEQGLAVITGSKESMQSDTQTPLSGSESGPYRGSLDVDNSRQRIKPGTVRITDKEGNVASIRDNGSNGAKKAELVGSDVEEGEIVYGDRSLDVTFEEGKQPAQASDLEASFNYRGLIFESGKVFAWHAYVFDQVKDGKICLKNPWGSWDPEPLSPADYLTYFSSLSTNQVPQLEETQG